MKFDRRAVVWTCVFAAVAASCCAQTLGLYGAPDCTLNELCVPPGPPFTVYVMVDQRDQPSWSTGLGSAGFRITGLPPSWLATATPNPALGVLIGDPLASGGVAVAFTSNVAATCVLLYTLELRPYSIESGLLLSLDEGVPSGWPGVSCPWVFYPCDFPAPSERACVVPPICAQVQRLLIRSDPGCAVAVTPSTWGSVKRMFQE